MSADPLSSCGRTPRVSLSGCGRLCLSTSTPSMTNPLYAEPVCSRPARFCSLFASHLAVMLVAMPLDCPRCGSPMTVVRSHRGKSKHRCLNCGTVRKSSVVEMEKLERPHFLLPSGDRAPDNSGLPPHHLRMMRAQARWIMDKYPAEPPGGGDSPGRGAGDREPRRPAPTTDSGSAAVTPTD